MIDPHLTRVGRRRSPRRLTPRCEPPRRRRRRVRPPVEQDLHRGPWRTAWVCLGSGLVCIVIGGLLQALHAGGPPTQLGAPMILSTAGRPPRHRRARRVDPPTAARTVRGLGGRGPAVHPGPRIRDPGARRRPLPGLAPRVTGARRSWRRCSTWSCCGSSAAWSRSPSGIRSPTATSSPGFVVPLRGQRRLLRAGPRRRHAVVEVPADRGPGGDVSVGGRLLAPFPQGRRSTPCRCARSGPGGCGWRCSWPWASSSRRAERRVGAWASPTANRPHHRLDPPAVLSGPVPPAPGLHPRRRRVPGPARLPDRRLQPPPLRGPAPAGPGAGRADQQRGRR